MQHCVGILSRVILFSLIFSYSTDLNCAPVQEAYIPDRVAYTEMILGYMISEAVFDSTDSRPGAVEEKSFIQVAFGASIPIVSVGTLSTIWLKFAGQLGLAATGGMAAFDLSVPVHAVLSWGGLRRKPVAWGFSGGLGINAGYRIDYDAVTLTPSLLAEVQYSPQYVMGLRLLYDLMPGSMGDGAGYHTWSVQYFLGW